MEGSREWRRLEVDIPAKVGLMPLKGTMIDSRIINVNPDGLCFLAPEGLQPGLEVKLILELPAVGATEVVLKVIWVGFFDKDKTLRAGGKLVNVDEREKDKFLRYYHLKVMSSLGG